MTSLLRSLLARGQARSGDPLSMQQWAQYFDYNSNTYPFGFGSGNYTLGGATDEIGDDFVGYVHAAYKFNGVVFACMLARLMLFSEARFQFRAIRNGRPGDLFGTTALLPLEHPWQNACTGDLLTRMMQDADLSGNAYIARRGRVTNPTTGAVMQSGEDTLRRLRPDWVTILAGSRDAPNGDLTLPDAEILGYLFHPGGPNAGNEPILYSVDEIAHFAPIPDPCAKWIGMSWLTPILRELQADTAAMTHKLKYFELGATPNLVVSMDPTVKQDAFERWIAKFAENHDGAANAYRTMYLGGGASAQIVGNDMKSIDFTNVQSHGELRIASAAGVPPIIIGLSGGLEAATYSNYAQARRAYADGTMRPLWRNASQSLATIIDVPGRAELWYDARDIAFLAEDERDAAEIQSVRAQTIHTLVIAGYTPDSVVAYIESDDASVLSHSGMYSVQLTPAGTVGEGKGALVSGVPVATTKALDALPNDVGRVVRALLNKTN